jgi:hypothetical protein
LMFAHDCMASCATVVKIGLLLRILATGSVGGTTASNLGAGGGNTTLGACKSPWYHTWRWLSYYSTVPLLSRSLIGRTTVGFQ